MTLAPYERARWLAQHILPHEAALRSWLGRRPIKGIDFDDVVQESYAILANLYEVDHIRNPRNYLFEVAKSVMARELRRARVVEINDLIELDANAIPSGEPTPEDIATARDELRRTEAAIAALPTKCREAFTLRKLHGISQRDVARRMGISEGTVEKHIGKALFTLMSAIGRAKLGAVLPFSESDAENGFKHERATGKQRGY